MADRTSSRKLWAIGGLLIAGVAWASPWDIDMIDSTAYKAYEWQMMLPPEGSVPREGPSYPRAKPFGYYQNNPIVAVDRMKADGMTDPYASDPKHVEEGKARFQVQCAPCHGIEGKGGGPVTQNDPAANPPIRRFPVPAPLLSGAGAVTPNRSDGYIYGTIRNGGAVMPSHGLSLTDAERWSIVAYIRTLDGAQYKPPAGAAAPAAPMDGGGAAIDKAPPPKDAGATIKPLGAPAPKPAPAQPNPGAGKNR